MAINYEFMNELMLDPQIAAMMRQRELGMGAPGEDGAPAGPTPAPAPFVGPVQPVPGSETPAPAPDSPLGQLIAMQPAPPAKPGSPMDMPPSDVAPAMANTAANPAEAGTADYMRTVGSLPPEPPAPATYDTPGSGILMAGSRGGHQQIRPENEPKPQGGGFMTRLKATLPRMLAAGIAAGATPSQYGGGALDIFRGMQAGNQELERRDTLAYDRGRQQSRDALDQRKTEAEIGHSDAATRYYDAESAWRKAQAGKAERVPIADDLYAKMNAATDPKVREEYHQLWLQALGHAPKEQPRQLRTRFGIFDTGTNEYITLDQQQIQKDRISQLRQAKGQNPQLWPDWAVMQKATPEEKMFVLTGNWKPEKETSMNPTELYLQATGGDAKRAVDLMQRPQLTAQDVHEKQQRAAKLRLADQQYQEELRRAEHDYNAAKAKLDAAGARPDTVDPKGNHSEITWDQYKQQNQGLIQQLTDAKNAAHRAHEAAAAELNPEGYTPHAGYSPSGTAVGAVTLPGAKSYMDKTFPGGM